jgi:hypothetical protein
MLLKFWQADAGLLGIFLNRLYITLEANGFYYTFANLGALLSFIFARTSRESIHVGRHSYSDFNGLYGLAKVAPNGSMGASASYFFVMSFVLFPLAFLISSRARRNCHS